MEFVDKRKDKNEASRWNALDDKQKRFIYLGMIIGMLIAGVGIIFLTGKYSIVAGCIIAAAGAAILISVSIVWLYWTHKISKQSQG